MRKTGILVLMYHAVVKDRGELLRLAPEDRPYAVSLTQFREQMDLLREEGITAVPAEELVKGLGEEEGAGQTAVLTFDDGYADLYTNAFPVLEEYGLNATCFLTAGKVGKPPYLSWGQVRELVKKGLHFGSHTMNHPFLAGLDDDAVRRELGDSKTLIEEEAGCPVTLLSLPGGRLADRVIDIARSSDYKGVFTSAPGINIPVDVPWQVKRVPIKPGCRADRFRRLLRRDRGLIMKMERSYRFKEKVKSMLGHRFYHTLYKLFS